MHFKVPDKETEPADAEYGSEANVTALRPEDIQIEGEMAKPEPQNQLESPVSCAVEEAEEKGDDRSRHHAFPMYDSVNSECNRSLRSGHGEDSPVSEALGVLPLPAQLFSHCTLPQFPIFRPDLSAALADAAIGTPATCDYRRSRSLGNGNGDSNMIGDKPEDISEIEAMRRRIGLLSQPSPQQPVADGAPATENKFLQRRERHEKKKKCGLAYFDSLVAEGRKRLQGLEATDSNGEEVKPGICDTKHQPSAREIIINDVKAYGVQPRKQTVSTPPFEEAQTMKMNATVGAQKTAENDTIHTSDKPEAAQESVILDHNVSKSSRDAFQAKFQFLTRFVSHVKTRAEARCEHGESSIGVLSMLNRYKEVGGIRPSNKESVSSVASATAQDVADKRHCSEPTVSARVEALAAKLNAAVNQRTQRPSQETVAEDRSTNQLPALDKPDLAVEWTEEEQQVRSSLADQVQAARLILKAKQEPSDSSHELVQGRKLEDVNKNPTDEVLRATILAKAGAVRNMPLREAETAAAVIATTTKLAQDGHDNRNEFTKKTNNNMSGSHPSMDKMGMPDHSVPPSEPGWTPWSDIEGPGEARGSSGNGKPAGGSKHATRRTSVGIFDRDWMKFETRFAGHKGKIGFGEVPFPAASSLEALKRDYDGKIFKKLCLRWHPDKFRQRWGRRLDQGDKEAILEQVKLTFQAITTAHDAR